VTVGTCGVGVGLGWGGDFFGYMVRVVLSDEGRWGWRGNGGVVG